jgi:hypothetical protein
MSNDAQKAPSGREISLEILEDLGYHARSASAGGSFLSSVAKAACSAGACSVTRGMSVKTTTKCRIAAAVSAVAISTMGLGLAGATKAGAAPGDATGGATGTHATPAAANGRYL